MVESVNSMDGSDSLRPPPADPPPWGVGRVLRMATGVREEVLTSVPSERARYTSMGAVVVGTAVMAMLSMTMALYSVFGRFQVAIVLVVPVWGMFILSLDRWLMSSASMGQSRGAFRKMLPRLGLSIALGAVLAEPLLLGIYNTAIVERVEKVRQQERTTREANLRTCNPVPGTAEAERPEARDSNCSRYRLAIGGDSPEALQSQLNDLTKQADELKKRVEADSAKFAEMEQQARLECNGAPGPGLTGQVGVGFECRRLRDQADQYHAEHKIGENGAKLTDLNNQINSLNARLGTVRNDYGAAVTEAIKKDLKQIEERQAEIGLLERFRALDDLVSGNAYVRTTQWAIRIFCILVDALPVILKTLNGVTPYDKLLEEELVRRNRVYKLKSSEEFDLHSRFSGLKKYEADKQYRVEVERIDERNRIVLGNHDERRGELIEALENHLLRTATGLATSSWEPDEPDPRVLDVEIANATTQELRFNDVRGGQR